MSLICLSANAQTTTLVTWNVLNFGTAASSTARIPYFQTVLDSLVPDILVVQEIQGDAGFDQFTNEVIANTMTAAPFVDGYGSDNALYYNADKFEAIANIPVETQLRDISQFIMVHNATNDTMHIFSVHLKASSGTANQQTRMVEVDSLRKVTDALHPDANFIVCGDFNIYKESEPSYQRLTLPDGETGYFIDPLPPMPGTWNNEDYAEYHTQSPRVRSFGGGASGGLDDRFDLILFSTSFSSSENVAYVENSTWPVGNDGLHYNDSINAIPNASVSQDMANALHYAADHLPVIASIEFFNTTDIASANALDDLVVFPNPSSGMFSMKLPQGEISNLYVSDAMGRVLLTQSGQGEMNIDLSHAPSGMYYLNVVSESGRAVVKLVVY